MLKKYKITEERHPKNPKIGRIEALIDFGDVKKGDKGGFIEKEENLSHDGEAWVWGNAEVYDDAEVYGDAEVHGNAKVYGNAKVDGNADVYGDAWVWGNAEVYGDAKATTVVKTFENAFYYDITVTDKHIKIGCQQHLKSEWVDFTDEEIIGMDGKKALKFWRIFKPLAEQLGLFEEV